MRYLLALLLLLVLAAGGAWVVAGRMAGPSIDISKPDKFVGLSTPLEVSVSSPDGRFRDVRVVFEQSGKQTPLYALGEGEPAEGAPDAQGRVTIAKTIVNSESSRTSSSGINRSRNGRVSSTGWPFGPTATPG